MLFKTGLRRLRDGKYYSKVIPGGSNYKVSSMWKWLPNSIVGVVRMDECPKEEK
jgi:hypothetical protein